MGNSQSNLLHSAGFQARNRHYANETVDPKFSIQQFRTVDDRFSMKYSAAESYHDLEIQESTDLQKDEGLLHVSPNQEALSCDPSEENAHWYCQMLHSNQKREASLKLHAFQQCSPAEYNSTPSNGQQIICNEIASNLVRQYSYIMMSTQLR